MTTGRSLAGFAGSRIPIKEINQKPSTRSRVQGTNEKSHTFAGILESGEEDANLHPVTPAGLKRIQTVRDAGLPRAPRHGRYSRQATLSIRTGLLLSGGSESAQRSLASRDQL